MIFMIEFEAVKKIAEFDGKSIQELQDYLRSLHTKGLLITIDNQDPKVSPAYLIRYYARKGYIAAYPSIEEEEELFK